LCIPLHSPGPVAPPPAAHHRALAAARDGRARRWDAHRAARGSPRPGGARAPRHDAHRARVDRRSGHRAEHRVSVDRIVVERATKRYAAITVFERLELAVREGETLCVLGPSGCGKTTLLRAMHGLVPLDDGSVL